MTESAGYRHSAGLPANLVSPPGLIWQGAGCPAPGRWSLEAYDGPCATCGTTVQVGVPVASILTDAFSQHADYLRFGDHVCAACAWLYSDPKRTHRQVLAVEGRPTIWPMLGWDGATAERPTWWSLLEDLVRRPAATRLTGIMTTDPKPRLWPRARLATVRDFGLYVHAPDYDVSAYVRADLQQILTLGPLLQEILQLGFSKRSLWLTLWRDYARARRQAARVQDWEHRLAPLRRTPAFVIALLSSSAIGGETDDG